MPRPKILECALCGNQQAYEPLAAAACSQCGSPWLEGRYDYEAFKREILRGLPGRPFDLRRYQEVLPINDPGSLDLYPAGGTPLWLSRRYAPALGHAAVYIKDERYGPTSSFNERGGCA
jgi:threonine synthase